MSFHLLIHNIGFITSAIFTLLAVLLLAFNNRRSGTGRISFILALVFVIVFIVSHVAGVNVVDPVLSREILMFNISIFFMGMFNVHAVLLVVGKAKEKWHVISFFYILGIFLAGFFMFYPDLFLHDSLPKMYFPNYYVPGALNWIRVAYLFFLCLPYIIYTLYAAYLSTEDVYRKNQLKFFIVAFFCGYGIGFIPNFLVYDITIDPLWGMAFMILFGAFFAYAAVKYGLMNIRVISKQALFYGLVVGSIGGTIVLLEYINRSITDYYANFPLWVLPAFSVLLVMIITLIIWRKIHEIELIRSEFITTVTHKFRTPLTQIKWSAESLMKEVVTPEGKEQLSFIQTADTKLVELTNLLVKISEAESDVYNYHLKRVNIKSIIEEVLAGLTSLISNKKINIQSGCNIDAFARCDESRIKFVIQTLIENAINYSFVGSDVVVSLVVVEHKIVFSVKDSGIGISKEELPFIFSKFYRGAKARITDTEGMGIGLFLSREIIIRHKGKLRAESDPRQGTTLTFSLDLIE